MRLTSVVVGLCMIFATALTFLSQERDLSPIMKEIGPAWQRFARAVGAEDLRQAAGDATRLELLFKEAQTFFVRERMKDAAEMAKAAASASAESAKAAKAGNLEAVKAVGTGILDQCRACHKLHREQLPDGTFRLKW